MKHKEGYFKEVADSNLLRHEIINGPEYKGVMTDMEDWLNKHL
jgi:hypothetical protein